MDTALKAILREFGIECDELLQEAEERLLELEQRPRPEVLDSLFRSIHTIKGNAQSLGITPIADLAHAAEDLLGMMRAGKSQPTRENISLLLSAVDSLRATTAQAAEGRAVEAGDGSLAVRLRNTQAQSSTGRSRAQAVSSMRVDTSRLDLLLDLTSELTIAWGRMLQLAQSGLSGRELYEAFLENERLFFGLQGHVMRLRMQPVGPLLRQFSRTVRDLAGAAGKSVRLEVEGGDVEFDARVIEQLRAPLTHLIRNAVDHGIESPEDRARLGKTPQGSIKLKAYHDAGSVVLEVTDDGRGIDLDVVRRRAQSLGMLRPEETKSDQEIFSFILLPGFSTAEKVTDVSGRGVGMDVVKQAIEALHGELQVDSVVNCGTLIAIRLPLTLAIVEGFSVGVGAETFILPVESVLECVELPPEERAHDRPQGYIELRGEPLPYVRLRHLFGLSGAPGRESVVVIRHTGGRAGLAVDRLYGEGQTLIKPLSRHFERAREISGSALLGDGRVALILDVPALMRGVAEKIAARATGAAPHRLEGPAI